MEETRNDHMADQLSTLALAHVGDGVYELLVRTRLARQGISRVNDLHRATVALVKAPAQAQAMEKLKQVDEVAYVRFASVYRQFKDINSFMEELSRLIGSKAENSGDKQ